MTLDGIVYTSNIITLSINSNINPVCNITNTNTSVSNNEINVSSQTTENFNLSITCDGKTYNANNDSLYIPVENIDRISKFTGKDSLAVSLDSLSSDKWKKSGSGRCLG